MLVTDLFGTFLKMYLDIDKEKSILIDGPWGCGKTYEINRFVDITSAKHSFKKFKKEGNKNFAINDAKAVLKMDEEKDIYKEIKKSEIKKVVYVSLYGAKNIEDIENKIIEVTKKKRLRKALKGIKIANDVLSVATPYKPIGDAVSSISNTLEMSTDKPKIKKGTMIIIDDLERVNYKEFSFVDLMGYIYSLISCQIKIVCVCCEEIITKHLNNSNDDGKEEGEGSEKKQSIDLKDYFDFKEKTFDRIIRIDKADANAVLNIASNYVSNIDKAEWYIVNVQNNLRVILNSVFLSEKINESFSKKELERFNSLISQENLFYISVLVISFVYGLYKIVDLNAMNPSTASLYIAMAKNFDTSLFDAKLVNDITDYIIFCRYYKYISNDMNQDLFIAIFYFYERNNDTRLIKEYLEKWKPKEAVNKKQ